MDNMAIPMPRFSHSDTALVWFRRDLRSFDHAALHHALATSRRVFCVFVFDQAIIDKLPRADRRIEFIRDSVAELDASLRQLGGGLLVLHGDARTAIPALAEELQADAVFVNRDYEPAAIARDDDVAQKLAEDGRILHRLKDQVVFEKDEVLTQSGTPFSVFTPYRNAWMKKLQTDINGLQPYDIDSFAAHFADPAQNRHAHMPTLAGLGFSATNLKELQLSTGMSGAQRLFEDFAERLPQYDRTRDFPAVKGPSYLSVHLRFGTVSIRGLVRYAIEAMRTGQGGSGAATWLNELIWRDFYFMILARHPHVVDRSFKPEYDAVVWEEGAHADRLFDAWCNGRTGYPLVDAAMAQINQTGYMHNRLRMVTASFLVKDLGIDWRRGERYFAEKLNDYDLSANNGGWQWAASTGCDAQPYFRIFNPVTQSEKFDPDGKFIRRYLSQLARLSNKHIHAPWKLAATELEDAGIVLGRDYPQPIVSHEEARVRTLQRYGVVKKTYS
ncbi:deoxyribodipyrimidine photo-lyase [Oxalicibacterium solurbis]|uniref:Deoxyribodipyrimidine photo-lyase n=2 Tax=Oxalicibacterium solurbis TaxID=69280 RepID=A0A8J3F8J2_9BURK|nr:deoxyribodipyrimidine photo-lyase [Oxalicibacterium solurbis]